MKSARFTYVLAMCCVPPFYHVERGMNQRFRVELRISMFCIEEPGTNINVQKSHELSGARSRIYRGFGEMLRTSWREQRTSYGSFWPPERK